MAEPGQNSSRTRQTTRVGRARARQLQRARGEEQRQTAGRAVDRTALRSGGRHLSLPKIQPPSLKSVQDKFSTLDVGKVLKPPRPRRSQPAKVSGQPGSASSPRVERARKNVAQRSANAQQVTSVPQHRPTASSTRPALAGSRSRRDQKTARTSQSGLPPVLVRGGMPDMASRRTKRSLPKRRFDVALDVPGAELHLPSLPWLHFGWRAISGLLAVMMVACLFFMWKSPAFQVNTVEAEGLQRLTIGDLNAVMDILGNSVFGLNTADIEATLSQAFPELSEISVTAGLPARVSINVVERQPVLAWYQEGQEVWVDAEGVAFPPRGDPGVLVRVLGHGTLPEAIAAASMLAGTTLPNGVLVMPGMTGEAAEEPAEPARLSVELVQAILTLGAQVPAETQLVFDSQHGLGWEDALGWEVYFGTQAGDMDLRLQVYAGVADYLTRRGIQPELVSVAFPHAPYYRMER